MDDTPRYRLTNRERSREFKRGRFWCRCDMSFLRAGDKCPKCGTQDGPPRSKRPTPIE